MEETCQKQRPHSKKLRKLRKTFRVEKAPNERKHITRIKLITCVRVSYINFYMKVDSYLNFIIKLFLSLMMNKCRLCTPVFITTFARQIYLNVYEECRTNGMQTTFVRKTFNLILYDEIPSYFQIKFCQLTLYVLQKYQLVRCGKTR